MYKKQTKFLTSFILGAFKKVHTGHNEYFTKKFFLTNCEAIFVAQWSKIRMEIFNIIKKILGFEQKKIDIDIHV